MRVACFGEILIRLSADPGKRLADSRQFDIHVGGAEANVAAALVTLGHQVSMASIVPDSELGSMVIGELGRSGIDTSAIHRSSGRMGLYFWEGGAGRRSAKIVYDRIGSAFADSRLPLPGFDGIQDCRLLHVSGISLALSESSEAQLLALIERARAADMLVSFDSNFRKSLWDARNCDPRPLLRRAISMCDFLFASHRDVSLILDWESPTEGEERRRSASLATFEAFPNLRMIASTARHVLDDRTHRISGRIDYPETAHATDDLTIKNIVDRIGTGDAFVAGILDGHILGRPPAEALARAMALMELKHGVAGDLTRFTQNDIDLMLAGVNDIRR